MAQRPATTKRPAAGAADHGAARTDDGRLARTFATVVGATFLLVGVAGFIPGVTTDFGDMQFAGHESEARLLGLFQVSILHNIVHLLFGVVGLWAARAARTSVLYLVAGGVVYLLLAAYGALIDKDHGANFVPVNTADDWLHLGLGVGMIALGLVAATAAKETLDRRRRA